MAKARPCVQCGAIFLPEFPRGAARMCSPECVKLRRRETDNTSSRAYRARNLAAVNAREAEYARANRAKKIAQWKVWAQRNRERVNANKRERYAKSKSR